jgi:hypothetical protein
VSIGICPFHARDLVEEASIALPLLDSVGDKMPKLEEVCGSQLEGEDHALVKLVTEYVLTCFWSRDPQISLESVVQGPIIETEEAACAGIEGTMKLLAELFEHQSTDA